MWKIDHIVLFRRWLIKIIDVGGGQERESHLQHYFQDLLLSNWR